MTSGPRTRWATPELVDSLPTLHSLGLLYRPDLVRACHSSQHRWVPRLHQDAVGQAVSCQQRPRASRAFVHSARTTFSSDHISNAAQWLQDVDTAAHFNDALAAREGSERELRALVLSQAIVTQRAPRR
jgi:hypothetical protein